MCITCMFGACRKHRRESDPLELLELGFVEPPHGHWEFGPGPLNKQRVLLTMELSVIPWCLHH